MLPQRHEVRHHPQSHQWSFDAVVDFMASNHVILINVNNGRSPGQ